MPKSFTVRDLPKTERPRERLIKLGPEALSSQELLALIIGRGIPGKSVLNISQEMISRFGSLKNVSEATISQLSEIKGINSAKAAQIKACFEIGKRQDLELTNKKFNLINPEKIFKMIRVSIKDKAKEQFNLVLLDSRNKLISINNISVGILDANIAHPREIFKDAINHNAASVVLVHNHPSGDPKPSREDKKLTKQLMEAGKIMGIEVVDHIIVASNSFFSFKDKKCIIFSEDK